MTSISITARSIRSFRLFTAGTGCATASGKALLKLPPLLPALASTAERCPPPALPQEPAHPPGVPGGVFEAVATEPPANAAPPTTVG
eukprot:CAMPEP_0171868130 /NCGR_PEP_ID=MMETSP0992-20121227/31249_1 /TAXON_ID=483369 /ORGANISM="non described non described, Strain CCMP2098" /LENGTH=86 /DNA_ID=CAMNT_0012491793 /DNA_START=327 /DNA_END=587 /DNA_ORIENTATION=+